ncbi:manP [Acrasis kona]|uniref:ManP n=1 Tax=Acrasis kona TaxID=1008807 RepID=A0AAW2Z6T2_9EUKA
MTNLNRDEENNKKNNIQKYLTRMFNNTIKSTMKTSPVIHSQPEDESPSNADMMAMIKEIKSNQSELKQQNQSLRTQLYQLQRLTNKPDPRDSTLTPAQRAFCMRTMTGEFEYTSLDEIIRNMPRDNPDRDQLKSCMLGELF